MERLLATDLDGTLLRTGGSVSERTRDALHSAVDGGIGVLLVTGRPPRWLAPAVEELDYQGQIICANGAVVLDATRLEPLEVRMMSAEQIADAIDLLRGYADADVVFDFAVERVADDGSPAYVFGPEYQPSWPVNGPELRTSELHSLSGVVKLLARARPRPGLHIDGVWERARDELSGRVEVTHSNPKDLLLEMSAAGVSKASTLAEVARQLGMAAPQVHAVGDMPNDLPMLAWSGHSYAVANAHPLVLEAAGEVLPSNNEDGVAVLLEGLLDKRFPH